MYFLFTFIVFYTPIFWPNNQLIKRADITTKYYIIDFEYILLFQENEKSYTIT